MDYQTHIFNIHLKSEVIGEGIEKMMKALGKTSFQFEYWAKIRRTVDEQERAIEERELNTTYSGTAGTTPIFAERVNSRNRISKLHFPARSLEVDSVELGCLHKMVGWL